MPTETLAALLERNRDHVGSLTADHFEAVRDAQHPEVVSICCADSRVSQEGMWNVDDPGWLFTPSNIGNQVWDLVDGELVVDGGVLYPIQNTDTRCVAVVGHTGCGAVTAALEAVRGDGKPDHPGVRQWVELLVPIVADGLTEGPIDPEMEWDELVDTLVEYNVREQVAFLSGSSHVDEDVEVFGFVYDMHGRYGGEPGTAYLVAANNETDADALRELVPEGYENVVASLLD